MQLKKIKRAEKKGTESVMDEKFALLFYTSVVVNDYKIRVFNQIISRWKQFERLSNLFFMAVNTGVDLILAGGSYCTW